MEVFVIFPSICIFLSIFSWVVSFFIVQSPGKALAISLLLTAPFLIAGLYFADEQLASLYQSSFVLGPITIVFVTYALYKKLSYADKPYAWLRAIGLFLVCAIGIVALGCACLFIGLMHFPVDPASSVKLP